MRNKNSHKYRCQIYQDDEKVVHQKLELFVENADCSIHTLSYTMSSTTPQQENIESQTFVAILGINKLSSQSCQYQSPGT